MIARAISAAETGHFDALAGGRASLFQTPGWLGLYGDQLVRCGIFDKGGALVGGYSLYHQGRLGLRVLRNPPYSPHCGPFLLVRASNPVAQLEERRRALTAMVEHLDCLCPQLISIRLDRRIDDVLPFLWHSYQVAPTYTYLVDLKPGIEAIKQGMSSARRNDIAKAERDGVEVVAVKDMNSVRPMLVDTFARKAKNAHVGVLDRILFDFVAPGRGYALAAMRGGKPISCCVIVHDAHCAYYVLGGYDPEDSHHGAGALALFEAMRRARELGLEMFDFEGSVIPEVEKFFSGFGGRLTPYFTVKKAWLPVELGLRALGRGPF